MSNRRTEDEFAYFNLLKFTGAICIAIFLHYNDHFLPCLGIENPFANHAFLWSLSHNSYVFTEMYFIISGILYSHAYMERIIDGRMRFDQFLIKRIVRVFPTLILTTLVVYAENLILYKTNGTLWSCGTLSIWELLTDCLFGGKSVFNAPLTLNGPIWFVNVLILCYIVAYILTKLFQKCRSVFLLALPIPVGIMMQYSGASFAGWNTQIARGYISFFVGLLLGQAIKNLYKWNEKQYFLLKVVLAIELAGAAWIRICPWRDLLTGDLTGFYTFLIFPEVILLLHKNKVISKWCATKFFNWCGNISFGIYLWNFPIYLGLHLLIISGHFAIDVTNPLFFAVVILLHLAVATISYCVIEKNSIKLGKYLR